MEKFDVDWRAVKLSLCTGASGAVIGAYLLVQVFGYVDPARVQLAAGAREAAVMASLACRCAKEFPARCAKEFPAPPYTRKRMVELKSDHDAHGSNGVFPAELASRAAVKQTVYGPAEACDALLLRE